MRVLSKSFLFFVGLLIAAQAFVPPAQAEQATIAVAANFMQPVKKIVFQFERETGHQVRLSFGSTGKLYAQIAKAAPFDAFLAADEARPKLAVEKGLAVNESRFTYARGRLVLWSGRADNPLKILQAGTFTRLAVANEKTAPYGAAAVDALNALGLWGEVSDKIVRGENIAQTYQFVFTGNAELGFVAASQLTGDTAARWPVPEKLHRPINQQAVLLTRGADNKAARAFLDFLKSDKAKKIILQYGYGLD